MMTSLKQIIDAYNARGFKIKHILADGQFECLRKNLESEGIMLNTMARDEHVPEVQRYIHTIKERARATINTLPFEKYPHRLIVEIIYNTVFWLNCFPHKNRIHPTLSPRTIVKGTTINYVKHCRVAFGTYVQVHEQHNNSMASCTSGAIALRPSGNAQGSYFFLNLHTGKRIIRNNCTVMPMTNEVINTIHQLAAACNKYKGIAFTDKDGNIINDDNDDNEDITETTGVEDTMYGAGNTEITGVDNNDDNEDLNNNIDGNNNDDVNDVNHNTNNDMNDVNENANDINNDTNDGNYDNIDTADDNVSIEGELPDDTYVTIDDINIVREMNNAQLNNGPETEEEEDIGAMNNSSHSHQYNLRPRPTTRNQKYTFTQANNQLNMPKTHKHIMMTQLKGAMKRKPAVTSSYRF